MREAGAAAADRRSAGDRSAAEAEVERDYPRLKPEILRTVRGKLAAAKAPIDADDLDASYNQAWHALYAELRAGVEIANRKGFLVQVIYRRAIDESRAARRARPADPGGPEGAGVNPDIDALLDDRIRLRQLMQGLRERLAGRELRAAMLCYVHGYSRPEAARALGVGRRRMEKIMDGASREIAALVGELREGDWCENRRSLIGAYALGLLDAEGERRRLAEKHLRDCPACRRRVLCMRGLAAVTPPVPALLAALQAGTGAAAGSEVPTGTGSAGRPRSGRSFPKVLGASGAAVAAAIGLVALGLGGLRSDGEPAEPEPAAAGAVAPAASRPTKKEGVRGGGGNLPARASAEAEPPPQAPSPPPPAESPPADPSPVTATPPPQPDSPPPSTDPQTGEVPPVEDGWSEFELR